MTLSPIQILADKLSCLATNKNDETTNPATSGCTGSCRKQSCSLKKNDDECVIINKSAETGFLDIDF